MDLGHWQYPKKFDVNEWVGFIYRIIDTETSREYIGKKLFFSKRSKRLKSRKNKVWTTKESDWKTYTSSSETINKLIKEHGKSRFVFIIESLHKSKAALTYAEVEKMIVEDALRTKLPNGERRYYNAIIPPIKFLPPHEESDEEASRLWTLIKDRYPNENFLWEHGMLEEEKENYRAKFRLGENNSTKRNKTDEEYEAWLNQNYRGVNNPMYGRKGMLSPRYGTHPFEKLTEEELIVAKSKMAHKGKDNGMFGRHPFANLTEEELAVVKEKMRHEGKDNGMYGKPCYYKMTEEQKAQWKLNIGKSKKGKILTEETKQKMRKPKGPQIQVTCPHCGKMGGTSNMARYHLDNCKLKS
jgi:hypothetical protein